MSRRAGTRGGSGRRGSRGAGTVRLRALGELAFDSPPARALLRRPRQRLLDEAVARGLSPQLAEPLRWLVNGELQAEDRLRIERVEAVRAELAARKGESAPSPGGRQVSLPQLALGASVDRRFGTLLYLFAKASRARTALELGSCVGIGTAYLCSAGCERVVTIEASPERAAIAKRTAERAGGAAEVVVGLFEDVLPGLLDGLDGNLDIAWIDGHHQRDATLRYFELIRPRLRYGAVVAFDDISWTPEMRDAWSILERSEGFADTIDLGAVGIGIWRGEGARPRAHDLRGLWGRPRWLDAPGELLRRR